MIFSIVLYIYALAFIFYLLVKICDQYFIRSLDIIARKFRLSEDIAGATFMAMGTSMPEFFTSAIALSRVQAGSISIGTIVGSAIFNILVIVGATAIVATGYLRWQPVLRDMSCYVLAIFLLLLTFMDGQVTLAEAALHLAAYAGYLVFLAYWKRWFPGAAIEKELGDIEEHLTRSERHAERKHTFWAFLIYGIDRSVAQFFPNLSRKPHLYMVTFCVSILSIAGLSWVLVELGIGLAHALNVSDGIVALTILAGGTSVPELVASLIVAREGRGDMAVSNAVGSNTFDLLVCLGMPWLVYILLTGAPVTVDTEHLFFSFFLLFFTVVAVILVLSVQQFQMGKRAGYALFALYGLYLCYAFYGAHYPDVLQWKILAAGLLP